MRQALNYCDYSTMTFGNLRRLTVFVVVFAGYIFVLTFRSELVSEEPNSRRVKTSTDPHQKDFELRQQLSVQLLCRPEDDRKHAQRHSSQPYEAPLRIESLFNCDHPLSECRYFYPANFFDPDCGLGRSYSYLVTDTEERLQRRDLWRSGPHVGFNVFSTEFEIVQQDNNTSNRRTSQLSSERRASRPFLKPQHQIPDPFRSPQQGVPQQQIRHGQGGNRRQFERISFLHVHKAGGTSMKSSQGQLVKAGKANQIRLPWFCPNLPLEIDQQAYESAHTALRHGVRYPPSFYDDATADDVDTDEGPILFYTVVRDPVERFVSSIGQVMGSFGSEGALARRFREDCLKTTQADTIKCSLDYVRSHSLAGFELHFAPQSLDIAFTSMWQDIPVAVFSMKESLSNLLRAFTLPERGGTTRTATSSSVVNLRNGTQAGYRPDPLLTQMSVQDFNLTLLHDVCQLYTVDVIMMQNLGIPTRCDEYV